MSTGDASGGFPGMLSQFDASAFGTGLGQAQTAMTNRYNQLGLGGGTAMQMDLGAAPSLTGGIPAEFQAGAGQVQTGDINESLRLAQNNLQTTTGNKSNLIGSIPGIGGTIGKIFG